ncbi:hypothetical protein I4U23_011626 [Adineta vaga]|nr:hypothetical protein I4U23_011626 [Adineta vaga]
MGSVYERFGNYKSALSCYQSALHIHEKYQKDKIHKIMYMNLGLIECKLENYHKSLDYFGQACEFILNGNFHGNLSSRILYNHIWLC